MEGSGDPGYRRYNVRKALDPSFDPDACTSQGMADEMAHERKYKFQPNIKIQLVTTSDGQKLGGIRLNMFRPATHTPSHNWHNNPACNKHLFWQKHGFKANLVQHADHIICHRQRCLVEGIMRLRSSRSRWHSANAS